MKDRMEIERVLPIGPEWLKKTSRHGLAFASIKTESLMDGRQFIGELARNLETKAKR